MAFYSFGKFDKIWFVKFKLILKHVYKGKLDNCELLLVFVALV